MLLYTVLNRRVVINVTQKIINRLRRFQKTSGNHSVTYLNNTLLLVTCTDRVSPWGMIHFPGWFLSTEQHHNKSFHSSKSAEENILLIRNNLAQSEDQYFGSEPVDGSMITHGGAVSLSGVVDVTMVLKSFCVDVAFLVSVQCFLFGSWNFISQFLDLGTPIVTIFPSLQAGLTVVYMALLEYLLILNSLSFLNLKSVFKKVLVVVWKNTTGNSAHPPQNFTKFANHSNLFKCKKRTFILKQFSFHKHFLKALKYFNLPAFNVRSSCILHFSFNQKQIKPITSIRLETLKKGRWFDTAR